MKFILHGENTGQSRLRLNALRSDALDTEVRFVDGQTADTHEVIEAFASGSLYYDRIFVICENFLIRHKAKVQDLRVLYESIEGNQQNADIIFWEKKDVQPSVLNIFRSFRIEHFPYPKTLFEFLDHLSPSHTVRLLKLYHDTLRSTAPEVVFALMVRRVRELLMVKDNTVPPKISSWQVKKLQEQSKLFSRKELIEWYKELFAIDRAIKTSTTPLSLSEHIESSVCTLGLHS